MHNMSDRHSKPDRLGRHPLDKRALDKRVLRLELAISGGAGLAPITGALPHVAGSARM
jgi:hypothetical protein